MPPFGIFRWDKHPSTRFYYFPPFYILLNHGVILFRAFSASGGVGVGGALIVFGRNLATDLPNGMPSVGGSPKTGVFRQRIRPRSMDFDAWSASAPVRNRGILVRAVRAGPTEISRLRGDKAVAGAQLGWVARPVPVADFALGYLSLPPLLAIWGKHGAGDRKIRVIDDMKASQINDLVILVGAIAPESLDVFLTMAHAHGSHSLRADLREFSPAPPPPTRLQTGGGIAGSARFCDDHP